MDNENNPIEVFILEQVCDIYNMEIRIFKNGKSSNPTFNYLFTSIYLQI